MKPNLGLTRAEGEQLTSLLRDLPGAPTTQTSFGSLLHEWTLFVAAVERGYDDSIYEYLNDLSVRSQLQELVSLSQPNLAEKLESAIGPTDERFIAATELGEGPLIESDSSNPPWWHRVPRHRVGELADDLAEMGL